MGGLHDRRCLSKGKEGIGFRPDDAGHYPELPKEKPAHQTIASDDRMGADFHQTGSIQPAISTATVNRWAMTGSVSPAGSTSEPERGRVKTRMPPVPGLRKRNTDIYAPIEKNTGVRDALKELIDTKNTILCTLYVRKNERTTPTFLFFSSI